MHKRIHTPLSSEHRNMNFKTRGLVVGGINTVACMVASLSRGKMDFFCFIRFHPEERELRNV